MYKVSLQHWIGNAAAVLLGSHGDVTAQADKAGCSRETAYQHARKVEQILQEAHLSGPSRADLLEQVQLLRSENQHLRQQLANRIEFDKVRRKRLAATCSAAGLSLNQIEEVFCVLLERQPPDAACRPAPSRATLGRWVLAACLLAGAILRVLDEHTRGLARTLCIDEIFFHGKPVLVAVEPHSMTILLCDKAADRTGKTWEKALKPFGNVEHVVADAGTGLQAGVEAIQQSRPKDKPLTSSLDVFHLDKEAQKPLGWLWRKVQTLWLAAEKADKPAAEAEPKKRSGRLSRARAAWQRVESYWRWYERWESGWKRLKAALQLFGPDGRLNTRVWASAEINAACEMLTGPRWAKVRRMATDPRMLNFLDRVEVKLAEAEPRPEVREALVELWRLERRQPEGAVVLAVAQQAICMKLAQDWQQSYARVSEVLSGVVRASSAVECVNSVLRMQQGRHRNVSQAMLDLKRLYWNCRVFEQGKRKDRCPYQHLCIDLPTYDFWDLLNTDPALLTQQLSTSEVTP